MSFVIGGGGGGHKKSSKSTNSKPEIRPQLLFQLICLAFQEATGVHASLRRRPHGPNSGRRVLSLSSCASVEDDLVEVAAEMCHAIILHGASAGGWVGGGRAAPEP